MWKGCIVPVRGRTRGMKKIIHFILVISLLMGLAPAAVFAEEDSGAQGLRGDIRDTLVSVGVLDADFSAWD